MGLFSKPLSVNAHVEKVKKYGNIDSEHIKTELLSSTSIFECLAKNDLKILQQCLYGFDKYSVLQWKDKAGWSLLHDAIGLNYQEVCEYLVNVMQFDVNLSASCSSFGVSNLRPIHIICELGNVDLLKLLLDKGANTELYVEAVKSELIEPELIEIGNQHKTYFNPSDTLVTLDSWTPLHLAAMYNNFECIQMLLQYARVWVDPVSVVTKQTPLILACKLDARVEIIEALLEYGCDVNFRDSSGVTAIYYGVLNGNLKAVEKLIRSGSELSCQTQKHQLTIFHAASLSQHSGSMTTLQFLLRYIQNNESAVPHRYLLWKCFRDKYTVRIGNQSVVLSDMNALTLLIVVLFVTNDETVALMTVDKLRALVEFGGTEIFGGYCSVNNISNVDPIQLFLLLNCHKNLIVHSVHKTAFLDILLNYTYATNNRTSNLTSAIVMATKENNISLVKRLLNSGAHPDIGQLNGLTSLMIALDHGYHEIQQVLLESGASPVSGPSPHRIICWNNNGDQDVSSNSSCRHNSLMNNEHYVLVNKSVPLHFAIKRGDLRAVKLLVDYGADVNETVDITVPQHRNRSHLVSSSVSILHLLAGICCNMELSIFKQMIDYFLDDCGLNVDSKTADTEETPLMFAVRFGRYDKCIYLIKRGSNINAVNKESQNSLHIAAAQQDKVIMHLLLTLGCDFNKIDENGRSVVHMVLMNNFRAGIDMLLYPLDYWECMNLDELPNDSSSACKCCHCHLCTQISTVLSLAVPTIILPVTHSMHCLEMAIVNGNTRDIVTVLTKYDYNSYSDIVNREFLYDMTDFSTMTVTPIFMLLESTTVNNAETSAAILKILLQHGCDINYASKPDDNTVLHLALRRNKVRLARLLMDMGANTELKFKIRDGTNASIIHVASILGQNEIIKYLMDRGTISINSTMTLRSVDRVSPLHLAALYNTNRTLNLLTHYPGCGASVQINTSRSDTFNALFTLISKRNVTGVCNLLETGAVDLSVRCMVGRSKNAGCLHIAAQVGNIEIVELLLDYGANPLATMITGDHSNILPIHLAIESGNYEIVRLLMDWGSNVNAAITLNTRQQVLTGASLQQVAVTQRASPIQQSRSTLSTVNTHRSNERGNDCDLIVGFSCLHYAVIDGNLDGVKMLLEAGANVNAEASDGNRTRLLPIHIAAQKGYKKIVKMLLEYGSQLNATFNKLNQSNLTAMYASTIEEKDSVVRLLLLCDADIDKSETSMGAQPFHIICQKGYLKLLKYFIGFSNVDINCTLHTGISALHLTSEKGYEEMTLWLLRAGMNPNTTGQITDYHSSKTSYNISPLNQACGFGHLTIVQLLIAFGADVEWRETFEGNEGIRPLHCAAIRGRINVLDYLTSNVKSGPDDKGSTVVDLNSQDDEGRTVLHWAVIQGFVDCVDLLLERGVDRTITDKTGSRAESYATTSNIRRLFA